MGGIHISLMERGDIGAAARVLSIAMLDNPLHVAVFQGNGENERLEIESMFSDLFLGLPGVVFLAKERDTIVGVMRMISCAGRKPRKISTVPEGATDIENRKSIWHRQWALRDPAEQHWHLGPIGVLPIHRRVGVGSLLMKRFCEEVDACAAIAYLETDLDENVRFYRKFGFEVVSESIVFDVPNRYMLRASPI